MTRFAKQVKEAVEEDLCAQPRSRDDQGRLISFALAENCVRRIMLSQDRQIALQ